MPDDFLNPYHFVPLPDPKTSDVSKDVLRKDPGPTAADFRKDGARGHLSHAAYAPNTLSGRIVVKLTTETPLVVGGKQEKSEVDYTRVQPYKFKGETAIPATSLRGMLSSIAEAASQSAMRVFHDKKPVSYRQPMDRALSAIGRLRETGEGLKLEPLTAPTIIRRGGAADLGVFGKWHRLFGGSLPLRLSFGFYKYRKKEDLSKDHPKTFARSDFDSTYTLHEGHAGYASRDPIYYIRAIPDVPFDLKGYSTANQDRVDTRESTTQRGIKIETILGQHCTNDSGQLTRHAHIRKEPRPGYVRGFIRILCGEDRDMAVTKKHEIFIPFPKEAEKKRRELPIKPQAIASFKALALEVADGVKDETKRQKGETEGEEVQAKKLRIARPYLPLGAVATMCADRRERSKEGVWEPELRGGQLVFFDIEEEGEEREPVVSAISFSQIWRGLAPRQVQPGETAPDAHIASLADFFRAIDKELLPFGPQRDTISPAEWLFGFVSAEPDNRKPFVAYASRVRISTGRAATEADGKGDGMFLKAQNTAPNDPKQQGRAKGLDGMVRLKTLGSPKPPSPQLYFYKNGQPTAVVPKEDLKPGTHWPQGRKFYLHQDKKGEPWETKLQLGWTTNGEKKEEDQARLRNAVKPIKDGTPFWFHIDFDNLSEAELGLLCFALQPSANFRHKLGMGKGIGLGTVHLEPQALCLVNRQDRYGATADVFAKQRYSEIILSPNVDHTEWPELFYTQERDDASRATNGKTCADRAADCSKWIEAAYPDALHALLKIGEGTRFHPQEVTVHTPLAVDQLIVSKPEKAELDTYKWFANNGEHIRKHTGGAKQLKRLKDSTELPTLKLNRKP